MEQVARWRLTAPHYINVEIAGQHTEWEHTETNRDTGRQARTRFKVPTLLNPDDPTNYNYPGEIIVANAPYGRDLVYKGPPTADMEPLNEAAQAITDAERPKWQHPIESLSGSYGEAVLDKLSRQLEAVMSKSGPLPQATSIGQVSPEQFAEMQRQVQMLMEQNAQLMAKLAGDEVPADEPLEEAEPATRRA